MIKYTLSFLILLVACIEAQAVSNIVVEDTGASNNFLTGISAVGAITKAQPTQANISGLTTADSPQFTAVNIGAATDTTLARSGAGAVTVEGVQVLLSGAALGTPSSGTLTNCTFPTLNQNTSGSAASLSVSGQTGLVTVTGLASTNRAKTVRDAADTILELGGSYTPSGTWTNLTMVTPVLGTPSSGTLTNCTALPVTGITASTSSALGVGSVELGHATDTTLARVSAGVVSIEGVNIVTTSTNVGGWTALKVAGSDFTTSSTSLVDVTGLVSSTLSTATLYEFEAVLYCNSTSTAGMAVGVQQSGGGTGQIGTWAGSATSGAATGIVIASNALNTAGAPCVLVNGDGTITITGHIKTGSTGSPTISLKVLKTTSGTAKVYIGSVFRYKAG
jgi:hypothetical protein